MDLIAILAFGAVFAAAAATPGPAVAALVARVLARGPAGIAWFCGGLVMGDLLWLAAAVFGLSALAAAYQPLFAVVRYAGAAYLLWLAWKLWTAPAEAPREAAASAGEGSRSMAGALALALGNPKTMLFYVALLPTLVPVDRVTPVVLVELGVVIAVVYAAVLAGYVLLAAKARRTFSSPRAMRRVNRATGALMAGAATAVVARG